MTSSVLPKRIAPRLLSDHNSPLCTTDMTNIKRICARLIELWDADCDIDIEINELRSLLADAELQVGVTLVIPEMTDTIERAIEQRKPEPPTDEEVDVWVDRHGFIRGHGDHPCGFWIDDGDAGALVRAALAHWGNQSPSAPPQ